MKAALCVLLLVTAVVYGAEEKKTEKRGLVGLGYGLGHSAPLLGGYYGHGLGLYNHGVGLGHGLALSDHGFYGHGLGLYGHGLYGHGVAAPVVSHSVYAAPVGYHAPLLGLGHGWH